MRKPLAGHVLRLYPFGVEYMFDKGFGEEYANGQGGGLTTLCSRLGYLALIQLLHAHLGLLAGEGAPAASARQVNREPLGLLK